MSDPAAMVVMSGTPSPPDAGSSSGGNIGMTTTSSRSQRINLRATTHEVSVLRQAAAAARVTLTSFIMSAALREAASLLSQTDGAEK